MRLLGDLGPDPVDHQVDDFQDLFLGELVEDDRLVDPVQELGATSTRRSTRFDSDSVGRREHGVRCDWIYRARRPTRW
jgi:hypothetical protein